MSEPVTVGVVGAGYVANGRHLPVWKELETTDLVGVADIDADSVDAARDEFDIPHGFTTLDEMLETLELDIVDVCTPPGVSTELCITALEAGCHVLTEKPLALDVTDAERLVETADKTGQKLCTCHQMLFYPPVMRARRAVEQGTLGEIGGVRVFISTPSDSVLRDPDSWIHDTAGGILTETGPHALYLSRAFTGPLEDVSATATNVSDVPWADWDDVTLELVGEEASASIRISHHANFRASELDIWGTEGRRKIDFQSMHYHRFRRDSLGMVDLISSSLREGASHAGSVVTNGLKTIAGQYEYGHEVLLREFAEAVRNDTDSPVPVGEAYESVVALDQAVESLHE